MKSKNAETISMANVVTLSFKQDMWGTLMNERLKADGLTKIFDP